MRNKNNISLGYFPSALNAITAQNKIAGMNNNKHKIIILIYYVNILIYYIFFFSVSLLLICVY